ncbi:TRAP transporter small permease [Poseidonocella sp. HB161398]|uniref:TRAP transporter small permease n=1 Tax=Poseidonocella sp. HB161398 TaxID=2320855 RepID=UPI001F1082F4|nr:TRAP transporter small permease [Poseidonocella sp. HB161398]
MTQSPADPMARGPGAAMSPGPGHALWPRRLLAGLCGAILLAMMGLTVVDVLGRYLFNHPLNGATELTELLLVSVIFLGLPAVCLDDEQVTVDLLVSAFPDWVQPWRKAALALVSATVLGVVAWRLWLHGAQIAGYNSVTNSLRIPVAPFAYGTAVCTAASVPVTLYVAIRDLARSLRT